MVLTSVTDELIAAFDRARSITVLTGAGISAESGVPTFRGGGGSKPEIAPGPARPVAHRVFGKGHQTGPCAFARDAKDLAERYRDSKR